MATPDAERTEPPFDWVTIAGAARLLKCSTKTIERRIEQRKLRAQKFTTQHGDQWYIDPSSLYGWTEFHPSPAAPADNQDWRISIQGQGSAVTVRIDGDLKAASDSGVQVTTLVGATVSVIVSAMPAPLGPDTPPAGDGVRQ